MRTLQELLEKELKNLPRQILEQRLAEKLKTVGLRATKARTRKFAEHILAGNTEEISLDTKGRDASIVVTDEDLEHVLKYTERFFGEQYETIVRNAAENIAELLYKSLTANWQGEHGAQEAEVKAPTTASVPASADATMTVTTPRWRLAVSPQRAMGCASHRRWIPDNS